MAVPNALLLLAVGWAHARVHIEDDLIGCAGRANAVDPMARQLSESAKVFGGCKPSGFEPADLVRRGIRSLSGDDPAHCWIVTQTLGIVHIFVPCETTERGLTRHAD